MYVLVNTPAPEGILTDVIGGEVICISGTRKRGNWKGESKKK
jgi:hypothetical protein